MAVASLDMSHCETLAFQLPEDVRESYKGGSLNVPIYIKEWMRGIWRHPGQLVANTAHHSCPCCRYSGRFVDAKRTGPTSFRCPNCASRPRDRQIQLILDLLKLDLNSSSVLHVAPEWPLFRRLKNNPDYVGGDIIRRRNANAIVDLTKVEFADGYFDALICNHVLEHIPDDSQAVREMYRVLDDDGLGIISVPIDKANPTWRPPADMPVEEVERRCGWDHKRFYGNDFSAFLKSFGFHVLPVEFAADVRDAFRLFEEPIFLLAKSGGVQRLQALEQDLVRWTAGLDS